MTRPLTPFKTSEKGNALLLVMVAVIFFGALSYMVINSGSGGTFAQEKDLMSAAQITQYPAALRTTVRRMITQGVVPADITFDLSDATPNGIFSQIGGGAFIEDPPAGIGKDTIWRFKATPAGPDGIRGWFVAGVGSDAPRGKDIFAYLDNLNLQVCEQILRGLGLDPTPLEEPVAIDFSGADEGTARQQGGAAAGQNLAHATAHSFKAWHQQDNPQPYACVRNGPDGGYVYYHVLVDQ